MPPHTLITSCAQDDSDWHGYKNDKGGMAGAGLARLVL